MKLYVYCLVEHIEKLPKSLHGIGGALVRPLEIGDFSFLVSDFPDRVVPVTRENALAHAAVIQSVLKETTPLPFRFGTLVNEQQLENYVGARSEALRAKLEQVRGCVEMNVKIISDREWTEEPQASGTHEKPGTAFLAEKRREILGGEARAAEAKQVAEWLEGQLAAVAKQTQFQTTPTEKLIVTAAHLVERERLDEFRVRVTEARHQRPDLHFLLSGPWAAYSFTNMDLEFKTHFGVS
jgi:hypothetical protein